MPTTAEALAITVLFLAPGLLYELGVSLAAGYQRPDSLHKVWRAFTYSLIVQAVLLPLSLVVWRVYGRLDLGAADWRTIWPLFGMAVFYVFAPFGAGWSVGRRQRARSAGTPSAWDHVFGKGDRARYVRIKLREGGWVAGVFGMVEDGDCIQAFASGYPDPPTLFLPAQLEVDSATGQLVTDGHGTPVVRDWGLLVSGEQIEVLEFQEISGVQEKDNG